MFKKICYLILLLTFIGPVAVLIFSNINLSVNWRVADRSSAKITPDPKQFTQPIIQIYAARTYGWRGLLAVHTWIALKPENAQQYTVYHVIGWNRFFGKDVLSIKQDIPDRMWFENKPWLIKDIRGEEASRIIPLIEKAADDYPYKKYYHFWPGPNSNTFTAYIGRKVPDLKLAIPVLAVGKDFLGNSFFMRTPSGAGYQFSIYGLFGFLYDKYEGIEINLLGLEYGIDPWHFDIILPGIGNVRSFIKNR